MAPQPAPTQQLPSSFPLQTQSHVEVFVPLPEGLPAGRVRVRLTTGTISVEVDEAPVLAGRLWREIKAEESTWWVGGRH